MKNTRNVLIAATLAALAVPAAQAQIKVGVTLSATGPAASLGIPERNTFAAPAEGDRRPEGRVHRPRRRLRHHRARARMPRS